jgi:hypothetical protein
MQSNAERDGVMWRNKACSLADQGTHIQFKGMNGQDMADSGRFVATRDAPFGRADTSTTCRSNRTADLDWPESIMSRTHLTRYGRNRPMLTNSPWQSDLLANIWPTRDDSWKVGTPHAVALIYPRLAARIAGPVGTGLH